MEDFRKMYAATQAEEAKAAKARRPRKAKTVPKPRPADVSWTPSAIIGLAVSAIEAFRRSCRGCLEICWKKFGRGIGSSLMDWFGGVFGHVVGKVEL